MSAVPEWYRLSLWRGEPIEENSGWRATNSLSSLRLLVPTMWDFVIDDPKLAMAVRNDGLTIIYIHRDLLDE